MTAGIATLMRPTDLGFLRAGIRHRTLRIIEADAAGASEIPAPLRFARLPVRYGRNAKLVFLTKRAAGQLLHTVA